MPQPPSQHVEMADARATQGKGQGWRRLTTVGALAAALALASSGAVAGAAGARAAARSHAIPAKTLAALRKEVASAASIPQFVAPGPSLDARKARGKSLFVIPQSSEIQACQANISNIERIGHQLGIKVTAYQDTGEPSQWASGITEALSEHYSAIGMICGINPDSVIPQLEAAQRAGVPVMGFQQNDKSVGVPAHEVAVTASGNGLAMQIAVDDALVNLRGEPLHALMVVSDESLQTPAMVRAAKAEVHKVCASVCTLTTLNVPIPEWSTHLQSAVSAALDSNSSINAVILQLDGMAEAGLPAVEAAHRPGLKIYTFGLSSGVVKQMETTSLIAEDTGSSPAWNGYDDIDQTLRVVLHMKPAPPSKEFAPVRMFTPSTAPLFLEAKGYGSRYVAAFKTLWGLRK